MLLMRHLMMRLFSDTYMEEVLQDIWMGMAATFLYIRYYDTAAEKGAATLVGLCLTLAFNAMWHFIIAVSLGCKWEAAYKHRSELRVSPGWAVVLGMAICIMQRLGVALASMDCSHFRPPPFLPLPFP